MEMFLKCVGENDDENVLVVDIIISLQVYKIIISSLETPKASSFPLLVPVQ